jgi:sugar phosphate isomerase/epimerase
MVDKKKTTPSFPPLATVCKKRFPFSLACPSFVYAAGYADNVRRLAPFVDEIELLFFESRFADSPPSPALVNELAQLARAGGITYNVHLPTDIFPGHRDGAARGRAVDVLANVIDRCAILAPTTFTLHLMRDPSEPDLRRWQDRAAESLHAVLANRISSRRISVENLDDGFKTTAPIIEGLDLSVCLDMGHLMARGDDVAACYDRWEKRITAVHLHGVDGAQDHLPLNRLSPAQMQTVLGVLDRFSGVVSLELFSLEALNTSLRHLLDQWSVMKRDAGPRFPASLKRELV